jgi:hypothetical protein
VIPVYLLTVGTRMRLASGIVPAGAQFSVPGGSLKVFLAMLDHRGNRARRFAGARRNVFAVRVSGRQIPVMLYPALLSTTGSMSHRNNPAVTAAIPDGVWIRHLGVLLAAGVVALNEWHIRKG